MYRFRVLSGCLAIALCMYGSPGVAIDASLLRLATTSSVENSGLLEILKTRFEQESGYKMKLYVVGSGAALRMGRKGMVDVIIAHSPESERLYMQEGYGAVRRPLMRNEFVLVGPAADPAAIRGFSDAVEALNRIVERGQTFVSRADDSGTHKRERKLWRTMGIDPVGKPWYQEAGMGMRDTLKLGNELQGYVLVDRGTWLAARPRLDLILLSFGDRRLDNTYSVISVSQNPHRDVNAKAGRAFLDWLTSDSVQALIGAFRVDGEPLFTPAEAYRTSGTDD